MKISVQKLNPEQWAQVAEDAHLVVFKESRKPHVDRIDFALVAHDDEAQLPCGYMTVRELDAESVYWQYGGAFPSIKGSIYSARCYEEFIKWHKLMKYKTVTTLVENDNLPYLKLAMHYGFRIIGVRIFKGNVLVELMNDLSEDKK